MSKDYAKFNSKRYEKNVFAKRRLVIFSLFFSLLIASIFTIVVLQKKGKIHLPLDSVYASVDKIKSFIFTKKSVTPLLAKTNESPLEENTIQYEFYDALPKTHLADNTPAPTPPAIKIVADEEVKPKQVAVVKPEEPAKKIIVAETKKKPIFSSEQLSEMIEKEKPEQQFILHLGEFQNKLAAEQFVQAIKNVSLSAMTVKVSSNVFRVQTGPYQNKEEAKLNQIRFQKRGIITKIEKLSA